MHGGHLGKFVEYSERKLIYLCNFSQILLFFGTNDISTNPGQDTHTKVVADLARAVAHIRILNESARIGICEIMPRPRDQLAAQSSDEKTKKHGKLMLTTRKKTNEAMAQWCFEHNIPFFHASSCLKGKDKSIPLFSPDNLHLSKEGTEHLQKYLEGKVGVLRGLPPQSAIFN
jgi:lysophospholipase L1-like esterase